MMGFYSAFIWWWSVGCFEVLQVKVSSVKFWLQPPNRDAPDMNASVRTAHLLQREDVLIEIELNLLVCDIDAQLLERVLPEVLKAKDIEDADVHPALHSAVG